MQGGRGAARREWPKKGAAGAGWLRACMQGLLGRGSREAERQSVQQALRMFRKGKAARKSGKDAGGRVMVHHMGLLNRLRGAGGALRREWDSEAVRRNVPGSRGGGHTQKNRCHRINRMQTRMHAWVQLTSRGVNQTQRQSDPTGWASTSTLRQGNGRVNCWWWSAKL